MSAKALIGEFGLSPLANLRTGNASRGVLADFGYMAEILANYMDMLGIYMEEQGMYLRAQGLN